MHTTATLQHFGVTLDVNAIREYKIVDGEYVAVAVTSFRGKYAGIMEVPVEFITMRANPSIRETMTYLRSIGAGEVADALAPYSVQEDCPVCENMQPLQCDKHAGRI